MTKIKLPYDYPAAPDGVEPWKLPKDNPWWQPKDEPFYIPLALDQNRWTPEQRAEKARRDAEALRGLHQTQFMKRPRPRLPPHMRSEQEPP